MRRAGTDESQGDSVLSMKMVAKRRILSLLRT